MRPDEFILGASCRTTPDRLRHAAEEVTPPKARALPELPIDPRWSVPESCEVTS